MSTTSLSDSSEQQSAHWPDGIDWSVNSEQMAVQADDPTGTETKRGRLESIFKARFRAVRGTLRKTLDSPNDALRLVESNQGSFTSSPSLFSSRRWATGRVVDDFRVQTDPERLGALDVWTASVLDRHVLEPKTQRQVLEGQHYTAEKINGAYTRGLVLGNLQSKQTRLAADPDDIGEVISNDRHQRALRNARLTTYRDLRDVTRKTNTEVGRTAAGMLASSAGAREFTNRVAETVDSTGKHRSILVAHSRMVDAVNEGVLRRGQELGAERVGFDVENPRTDARWTTAASGVCEQCSALEGSTYTITEVLNGNAPRPVRNTHPLCRCLLTLVG